jgi:hypothetical protein
MFSVDRLAKLPELAIENAQTLERESFSIFFHPIPAYVRGGPHITYIKQSLADAEG